jgi:hypothetical protein
VIVSLIFYGTLINDLNILLFILFVSYVPCLLSSVIRVSIFAVAVTGHLAVDLTRR